MKNKDVVFSSGSREDLEKMVNEFYCSSNWVITEDNRLYNMLSGKYSDLIVRVNRGRCEGVDRVCQRWRTT